MAKKTSDIYFCSAMLALGANLIKVDRQDPRHMQFELDYQLKYETGELSKVPVITSALPLLDLDKVELDWANGLLMVNATKYADALKQMKSVVHSRE